VDTVFIVAAPFLLMFAATGVFLVVQHRKRKEAPE